MQKTVIGHRITLELRIGAPVDFVAVEASKGGADTVVAVVLPIFSGKGTC